MNVAKCVGSTPWLPGVHSLVSQFFADQQCRAVTMNVCSSSR
jgi:hypothetical protein